MFELNKIKYDFKRVTVADAMKAKNILIKLASVIGDDDKELNQDSLSDLETCEPELIDLSLKYLRIYVEEKGSTKTMENVDEDFVALTFNNPLAVLEIYKSFCELIKGFLTALPSYQTKGKR